MTPIKMSIVGINQIDAEYAFDEIRTYTVSDVEEIKQYVGDAFFGNEAIHGGKIIFTFRNADDEYILKRDFISNDTALTVNGAEMTDANEIDGFLKKVIGLSDVQWEENAVIDNDVVCEAAFADVEKYIDDAFSLYNLPLNKKEVSTENCQKNIDTLNNKIEVLRGISDCDNNAANVKIAELQEQITADEEKLTTLYATITEGKTAQGIAKILAEKTELYSQEEAKAPEIDAKRARLAQNERLKEQLSLMEKLKNFETNAEELKKVLDENSEKSAELTAAYAAGEKIVKDKENEYIEASDAVTTLNEQIDTDVNDGKNTDEVLKNVNAFCAEGDRTLSELQQIKNQILDEKASVDKETETVKNELVALRISAEYKKAIREGACFETVIFEKEKQLKIAESTLEKRQEEFDELNNKLTLCKEDESQCQLRADAVYAHIPNVENRTPQTLINELNALEKEKQNLYRNQILSATLLQDVNAIDKKIAENTEAKHKCAENIATLTDAKTAMLEYNGKCAARLAELREDEIKLNGRRANFEEVENIEYGGKCPVCSAPITDKSAVEKAFAENDEKLQSVMAEITHLQGIRDEYAQKLDKINMRLGSLESQERNCTGYITSLEATKLSKLNMLKSFYKECNVRTHDEITNKLEAVIARAADISTSIASLKEIAAERKSLTAKITELTAKLKEYEDNILPSNVQYVKEIKGLIAKFVKEYSIFAKTLNNEPAISKLDDMIKTEVNEDELIKKLDGLTLKQAELNDTLSKIYSDIALLEGHTYPIRKNGKDYTYATLCINATNESYGNIINELRKAEANKQVKLDELNTVTQVLQKKQNEINELQKATNEIQAKYDETVSYINSIKESDEYNAELISETQQAEIMDEELTKTVLTEVTEYDNSLIRYRAEIDALNEILTESKSALDNIEANENAAEEIKKSLTEKQNAYAEAVNALAFSRTIENIIAELQNELTENEKELNAPNVLRSDVELLIAKANDALCDLSSQLKLKAKDKGIVFTDEDGAEKNLQIAKTEEYALVGISLAVAQNQILSETSGFSALRIVCLQENDINEETKLKLVTLGQNNGLIVLLNE